MNTKARFLAASLIALMPSFAFAQNRNVTLEPPCSDSGSGMDPVREGPLARDYLRFHDSTSGEVPLAPCIFTGLSVDPRAFI
ncbi:MAG: hypothetical protein JWL62_3850 [Hyphomicrobiales bacterium]|nr:hypothetical protein [Hyphomicrobiales bacterium]